MICDEGDLEFSRKKDHKIPKRKRKGVPETRKRFGCGEKGEIIPKTNSGGGGKMKNKRSTERWH